MKDYGLQIRTYEIAGRYQHEVTETGVKSDRKGEVSNAVVEALQRATELLWEELPEGAGKIVTKIMYQK